jgi:hypothetical protein
MQSQFGRTLNADLAELSVRNGDFFNVQGLRYEIAPYFLPRNTTNTPDSSIGTAAA